MNDHNLAITLSLVLHGIALFLTYTFGNAFTPSTPVVIDFTLTTREPPGGNRPSPGPAAPPTGTPERQNPLSPRGAPQTLTQPARPQARHTAVGPQPAIASPRPIPATSLPEGSGNGAAVTASSTVGNGQGKPGGGDFGHDSGNGTGGGTGSGRGKGSGGEQPGEQLRSTYRREQFAYIKKLIEEHLSYPSQARRMQWEGTCKLSFVVLENGHATEIKVLKGTGHAILDDNVVETIKRVSPFPRPPISVSIVIPFTYTLN